MENENTQILRQFSEPEPATRQDPLLVFVAALLLVNVIWAIVIVAIVIAS